MSSGINVDPITLEVVRNRLESIVREMGDITLRTARSSVVYNARDFSCGLLNARCELLAIGTSVPVHIFPTMWQVKYALDKFKNDVHPGDIFIGNDPFEGGSHLNDVLLFLPIFYENELVGFSCNRAHWYDVGGMVPGSLSGSSREIYQEGLRIPAIRIGQNEILDTNILDLIMRNVRVPGEASGDLWAQLASCRVGRRHVIGIMERYGKQTALEHFNEILDSTERRMRSIIQALPQQTVMHEGYVDNDGVTPDRRLIKVAVSVKKDKITVDYSGTSPQTQGPMNVGQAVGAHYAFIGVKSALDPKGPINSGTFRPIETIIPDGTMLNAKAPAAIAGQGELGQSAILTMVALAKLVPERICAEEGPSSNHQNYSGIGYRYDDPHRFIYYDVPPSGGGGRAGKDGLDFVRSVRIGNVNVQSIEVLEQIFPMRFHKHAFRQDSGGPGMFRGGLGCIREYHAPVDGLFSMLSENSVIPLGGVFGGQSGALAQWEVIRNGETLSISPEFGSKVTGFTIKETDSIRFSSPGGGGYGDPLERDTSMVQNDLMDGKVSMEKASEIYGVIFNPITLNVDENGTRRLRAELATNRIYMAPRRSSETAFENGMRVAYVSSKLIRKGFSEDAIAEICSPNHPATFRVSVKFNEQLSENEVLLDEEAWKILDIGPIDQVLWRTLY